MIYYVVEVETKWRGHDYESLRTVRENFKDALGFIESLANLPFEIDTTKLKQYAFNGYRTTLLNSFYVKFTRLKFWGEKLKFEASFEYENVSYVL